MYCNLCDKLLVINSTGTDSAELISLNYIKCQQCDNFICENCEMKCLYCNLTCCNSCILYCDFCVGLSCIDCIDEQGICDDCEEFRNN